MARPIKFRRVEFFPEQNYFIPFGKRKCEVKDVVLKVEELEAMRLKDIEGITQEECAEKMNVSRQTFQNIIDSARKKVAIALTEGNAIMISGGSYTTKQCKLKCNDCGNEYQANFEVDRKRCPKCNSTNVICEKKSRMCKRWCSNTHETI